MPIFPHQITRESLLEEMSRFLQDHTQNLDIRTDSVVARATIARGTKFGPFIAKFTEKPLDQRYAWEVSVVRDKFTH